MSMDANPMPHKSRRHDLSLHMSCHPTSSWRNLVTFITVGRLRHTTITTLTDVPTPTYFLDLLQFFICCCFDNIPLGELPFST